MHITNMYNRIKPSQVELEVVKTTLYNGTDSKRNG